MGGNNLQLTQNPLCFSQFLPIFSNLKSRETHQGVSHFIFILDVKTIPKLKNCFCFLWSFYHKELTGLSQVVESVVLFVKFVVRLVGKTVSTIDKG